MGWWDEGIMGGDTPYDVQGNFEEVFGVKDPTRWYGEGPAPAYRIPTADESLAFLNDYPNRKWYSADELPVVRQVTGYCVMERGAPMSDELRAQVLEGIDDEIDGGCEEWNVPQQRIDSLKDFRTRVEAYPAEGGATPMPKQTGLMEKIADRL